MRINLLHKPILKAMLLLVFFTLFVENTHAQRGLIRYFKRPSGTLEIPQHLLCFETGMYSRGIMGLSYYANEEIIENHSFISTFLSIGNRGIIITEESNFYGTLGFSYNIGRRSNYFSVGPEIKYIRLYYWKDIDWTVSDGTFNGPTYGGFVGYTKFRNGLMLQARLSYMRSFNDLTDGKPWYNLGRGKLSSLGLGITLGWNLSFKEFDLPVLF